MVANHKPSPSLEQSHPALHSRLKDFVDELNEKLFDERIESDVKAGKLDWLADKALADHKAGLSRKFR